MTERTVGLLARQVRLGKDSGNEAGFGTSVIPRACSPRKLHAMDMAVTAEAPCTANLISDRSAVP